MANNEKIYVLDTNILVHDPMALFAFEGALIGIPSVVLEEIDQFKREASARGRNIREVIRQLDMIRQKGSLGKGVLLENGATVRVFFMPKNDHSEIPFKLDVEDNQILLIAYHLKKQGYDVRFVSKDINARVKADALGIQAVDYLKERVSEDAFYKGWFRISVPSVQLKQGIPDQLYKIARERDLMPNEYILVESQHNPHNYRVFRHKGSSVFELVREPQFKWPLHPKNPQQLMALDALLDDTIQLVTLVGPAGTGKTFLTLLAALHKVLTEKVYEKILISRPVIPLGRDIGYLPGTLEEKLHSWMLPIYDNIEFIVHTSQVGGHLDAIYAEQHGKSRHKKGKPQRVHKTLDSIEELVKKGKLSLEAITYMRGRSIPYQFILIDEVQNLTPHEVKTLVSRVGQGSKIILAGDPYQIDSPYLDFSSNGLMVTSEKFKGENLFASVYLETSERSELSQLANDLL